MVLAIPSIAYRLALAAAGEVDVALSITDGLGLHDVAAGLALVNAAGGRAVELDGTPMAFRRHGGSMAASPGARSWSTR